MDKNDLANNWSVTIVGAFKRLILRVEGTEHNNDLTINWSAAYVRSFKRLILWIEGIEEKMILLIIDQLLMWELLKDLYYRLKVLWIKMT